MSGSMPSESSKLEQDDHVYHWLSTCHDAEIKSVSGDEGTTHAECTECGKSCNLYDKNTADAFNPIIQEIVEYHKLAQPSDKSGQLEQELYDILDDHYSIITESLGKQLIAELAKFVSERERAAQIDAYQNIHDLMHMGDITDTDMVNDVWKFTNAKLAELKDNQQ